MIERFHKVDGTLTWHAFEDLGTRQTIHRNLRELHKAGLIDAVDEEVSLKGQGKPALVWAPPGYRPRRNQTKHDLIVSLLILAFGIPARRGRRVDKDRRPDVEWLLPNDQVLNAEVDTGSMSYPELVEDRYTKYEGTGDIVIWISCGLWGTKDQTRLAGMKERAGTIKDIAWFVALGEIMERKENAVLTNFAGEELSFAELCRQVAYPDTNPEEMTA